MPLSVCSSLRSPHARRSDPLSILSRRCTPSIQPSRFCKRSMGMAPRAFDMSTFDSDADTEGPGSLSSTKWKPEEWERDMGASGGLAKFEKDTENRKDKDKDKEDDVEGKEEERGMFQGRERLCSFYGKVGMEVKGEGKRRISRGMLKECLGEDWEEWDADEAKGIGKEIGLQEEDRLEKVDGRVFVEEVGRVPRAVVVGGKVRRVVVGWENKQEEMDSVDVGCWEIARRSWRKKRRDKMSANK